MRRGRLLSSSVLALALAASCTGDNPTAPDSAGARPLLDESGTAAVTPATFCNPASITINQAGAANPYPSLITASGIASGPTRVSVTLSGFSHTATGDIDMLLVGPGGENVMLMSDAGGSSDFQNATVTFDDAATAELPLSGSSVLPGGTYKPVNFQTGDFFPNGPAAPFGAALAVFHEADLNGTWRLFIWDDLTFVGGAITNGWCLTVSPLTSIPVANAGGPYTVAEGSPLTFDGTGSTDAGNDIVSYEWDFGDGFTGTGPAPQHAYANGGTYTVSLVVRDTEGAFDDASTTVTVIDDPTSFCSTAPITIRDNNSALPYPSLITVAGAGSGAFKVRATVKGISHRISSDVDMLLAGPGGQTVMLMSDAAGVSDLVNATLTFDDAASAQLPASGSSVLPSGTYQPTNFGSPDAMPAGAPAEPYGTSLAGFGGTDPNGTWRLFLRDDLLIEAGSVTGGWCVYIIPTNAAPVANAGGPYSGTVGSPIAFDGTSSTDPDNNIESYAWDFGDGNTGTGPTVEHTYASGGTYTVTLLVTDQDGASDDATVSVTVAEVAPTATFSHNGPVSEGSAVTLSFTSPSTPGARYAFDCGSGYGAIGSASSAECPTADNGTLAVRGKVVHASIDDLFTEYTEQVTVTNVAPTATFTHNGPVTEGVAVQLQLINPSDVAADVAAGFTFVFDCGPGYGTAGPAGSASCPTTDNGDLQVKGKIIDKDGGESEYAAGVSVTNVAPVVTSLSLPSDPVAVNAPVTLGAAFTDPGTADTHTGSFELGAGGPVAPATVLETAGSGTLSAGVSFAEAGVYTITARVTDDDGGTGTLSSATSVPAFVVVYDPAGGFVTGGGWISSPAGAYALEPTFTGRANFGFVARYRPGANQPSGNTEFQLKAGGLNFKSTSYDWLVVAGAQAKYKGEGTINGGGSYGFMSTAIDGDRHGGASGDAFRIRIWELGSGAIVYDNKMGEDDSGSSATALGGGSIVIHR